MAARNKASLRDFNRRRNIMLTKAFDMVFYQRGTNLSKCLLRKNPKESENSIKNMEVLSKKEKMCSSYNSSREKEFIENRWKTSIEPSILMRRPPTYNSVSFSHIPRYRRPVTDMKHVSIETLMLARPIMKKKFNTWETTIYTTGLSKSTCSTSKEPSMKEKSVHFEPAVSRGGVITSEDRKALFDYWFNKRVSSGRDDATRQALIETQLKSTNKQKHSQSLIPKPNISMCSQSIINRPNSVSSENSDKTTVFINQCNPDKILTMTKIEEKEL